MLLPWVLYFYLLSFSKTRYVIASALTVAVMFLSGGVYPFYAAVILLAGYSGMLFIEKRKLTPVLLVVAILLIAFLFGAVKFVPMLAFVSNISSTPQSPELTSVDLALSGFASRTQNIEQRDSMNGLVGNQDEVKAKILSGELPWGWHEYSAYIGIALILVLLSLIAFKRNWKLWVLAVFFLLLSLGTPLWNIFQLIPFFNALHGPSRFAIPVVFMAALLAGRALSGIKLPRYAVLLIILVIALDLLTVSFPIVKDTFQIEPLPIDSSKYDEYIHIVVENPGITQYPNLLQNLDTVNCYERVKPANQFMAQFDDSGNAFPQFIGNAYMAETNKTARIVSFSSNEFVVDTNESGILVLNQNFLPGWKANGEKTGSYGGLVATETTGGITVFSFTPPGFILGLLLTVVSLIAGLIFFIKPDVLKKLQD